MRDTSFADKISRCEITIQNLESEVPNIPGGETYVAEMRQRVEALRESQEGVQSLRGQLTEAVIVRQQRDREASASLRNLAAVVRARFGFANPVIESFNIRSEHRAKRGRKPKAKPVAAEQAA
ncbi:MAG TPA: hypothetical protein VGS22_15730 [Thermoanaerobaculia bacterium]|jgi:hypothetical protein|nr:hypothetical protein [Thermoanaerobaculia bacterium]